MLPAIGTRKTLFPPDRCQILPAFEFSWEPVHELNKILWIYAHVVILPQNARGVKCITRYIYYLTDLHSSQKSKGIEYYKLVRTYQITFYAYTIFPENPDYINRFSLRRPNGEELSDQINMIVIELSKLDAILKKPVGELNSLEMWSIFFKYAPDERRREYINQIISEREEIAMTAALLTEISKDEQERARQRSRRMYETDQISNLLTAEARGEAKGEVRGEAKGEARGKKMGFDGSLAAIKGLKNDIPLAQIAAETGLSISEIEKLQSELI